MSSRASRPWWFSPALHTILGLAILGPFCFRRINETDLGWHLALGRLVAHSGIPRTNALCWPAVDQPWFSNSWLFDWLSYEVVAHGGLFAVQCLIFVVVALTLIVTTVAGVRANCEYGAAATPILALLLIRRVTWRSFVASWAALGCVLWLCLPDPDAPADHGRSTFRRRLWCLPVIALASNLHQGAIFSAGVLGLFCAESFLFGDRQPREILLALGGVLALAANPGGTFGLIDSLSHFNIKNVVPIPEYAHTTLKGSFLFFLLAAVTLLIAWRERRRRPAMLVAVALFTAMGVWSIRFVYDFGVVGLPLLGLGLAWLADGFGRPVATATFFVGLALVGMIRAQWISTLKPLSAAWDPVIMPMGAAEFVRAEHLDGHMFNSYSDGGYLEWALPELLWFQDGRPHAFPDGFFKDGETNHPTPEIFRAWLDHWGVEWAITRMHSKPQHVLHTPDWALVYWDGYMEVFVRRSAPRFASLIQRLEYRHFQDGMDGQPKAGPLLDAWWVKRIASAPRTELPEWRDEMTRFEKACSSCRVPPVVRCALAARTNAPDLSCDDASAPEELVAAARSIHAAP